MLKRKPRVENAVDASEEGGVLSPACRLQLRHCGAVAATCQRAVYMRYIDDCYRELTDKQAAQSEIKQTLYDVPLCIYSLNGKCENQVCFI